MALDARKSLPVLRDEWSQCTKCSLGETRVASGGAFVFGEGSPGGLMFIGSGPSEEDNETGRPFSSQEGLFFRKVLSSMGIRRYYLTNIVCCRSFKFEHTREGQQRYVRRNGVQVPLISDAPPLPAQRDACLPRLHEEIYLVDPLLIITLGEAAAEAVLGRTGNLSRNAGELLPDTSDTPGTVLHLPGAGHAPSLTPKGAWRRKLRKEWIMPTKQSEVLYPVIPLLHPAKALENAVDATWKNNRHLFALGLARAKKYYDYYMNQVYGETTVDISVDDIESAMMEDEE